MRFHVALICALAGLPLSGCYGLYGNDEFERYAQRKDTVTLSAGDAKEVNARTHMNDPWPHGVGDRRIPGEGSRMVRAMEQYRNPPQQGPTGGVGGQTAPPAAGGR